MKSLKNAFRFLPLVAIAGIIATMIISNGLPKEEEPAQAAAPSISMTINGDLDLEVTPEVDGAYGEAGIEVVVNTNNVTGYSLTMGASDTDLMLESEKPKKGFVSGDGIIRSINDEYAKEELPLDSWGFSVDGGLFAPIPSQSSPSMIKNTSTASPQSGDTTTVTFGVNVSPAVKSGDYESVITLLAVANVSSCEGQGFYCIDTMQAMTTAICDETTTPYYDADEVTFEYSTDRNKIPRTILTDVRDGKTYLVSKFADGKCWMSQSLELELDNTVALTSDTTDLNSKDSWTPENSTTSDIAEFTEDALGWVQYGEHDFLYEAESLRPETKYFRGGTEAASSASTNDGKSEWEKSGYYYNYQAATAGSLGEMAGNIDLDTDELPDSICPKGWRLPVKDNNDDYDSGYSDDIYRFLEIYGDSNYFSDTLAFSATGFAWFYWNPENGWSPNDILYGWWKMGTTGEYWANKHIDDYYLSAPTFLIRSNDAYADGGENFDYGVQIRCVFGKR